MLRPRETWKDPAAYDEQAARLAAMFVENFRQFGDVAEADPRLRPIDPKLLVGVSRNAPCPCGSGKKFKHCHGSF